MNKKLYIKHLLKQYRPFILLIFFLTLADPILTFLPGKWVYIYGSKISMSDLLSKFYRIIYLPSLALLLGFFVPFLVFSHLYRKSDLDNYWSTPAKRSEFFLTHFFVGYVFLLLIPLSLSYVLHYAIDYYRAYTFIAGNISILHLISGLSILLTNAFVFYTITTLAITLSSSIFNGVIVGAVFQSFFPLLHALIVFILSLDPSSLNKDVNSIFNLYWLNLPLSHFSYFLSVSEELNISRFTFIIWFILSIVLFFVAMKLHEHRKVERIATTDMFKAFYPTLIFIFGTLVMVFGLTAFIDSFWLIPFKSNGTMFIFIVGLIVFSVVQLARFHGKPPIVKNLLAYLCIFIVSYGISYAISGPVKNMIIMSQAKPSKIGSIEIINPVNDNSDFYTLLNIGTIQQNKDGGINPDDLSPLNKRPNGYVNPENGKPYENDTSLSRILDPENLKRESFNRMAYDAALKDYYKTGNPLFKSKDEVDLAEEHITNLKPINSNLDEKIYMEKKPGKNWATYNPNKFHSRNFSSINSYEIRSFTEIEAIKTILNIEKKELEEIVIKNKNNSNPHNSYYSYEAYEADESEKIFIRIMIYDKKGKLISAREFPLSAKADFSLIQEIFNGRLFYKNGVKYSK